MNFKKRVFFKVIQKKYQLTYLSIEFFKKLREIQLFQVKKLKFARY